MAVEKAANANSYASQNYQNSVEPVVAKKEIPEKNEQQDIPEVKRPDALDYVQITLDKNKEKKVELTIDDKIQDAIDDQKFVHEKIRKSLDEYSSRMGNYEAKFGVHEATNRLMIKMVDKDTKEVVKEFPPEKTLDMIAKCLEQAGVLVDEKV